MAIEQVQKGWLRTRDNTKYAPKTFTQNVIDLTNSQTLDQSLDNFKNKISNILGDINDINEALEALNSQYNSLLPFILPSYSTDDEGKVLAIVNGKPTWVSQFNNFD